MKILIPTKRVVDYTVKIRIKNDGSAVETNNVKMSMNPFDEIALEEALRIKEKNPNTTTIAVSIGPKACDETLRHALALGIDDAILVEHDENLEPLSIAKILKKIIEDEKIDLVIMGKQSIDGDNNQTGQMLAALLDCPQATFASKVILENNHVIVTREIDGGLETIRVQLPAVITTDLRLNQPRYASLPNIMKAKRKTIRQIAADSLGIKFNKHTEIMQVEAPPTRKAGVILKSVAELVEQLKNQAGVL